MVTRVTDRFRVTLPPRIRKRMGIQIGDPVEIVERGDHLVLKPKKLIDSSQAYFWTKEWQAKERQVDEDFRRGRYQTARSAGEFLRKLKRAG